jgi:hypothetical protein
LAGLISIRYPVAGRCERDELLQRVTAHLVSMWRCRDRGARTEQGVAVQRRFDRYSCWNHRCEKTSLATMQIMEVRKLFQIFVVTCRSEQRGQAGEEEVDYA